MAWSRILFFPEQTQTRAPPMWNRPSTSHGTLMSLTPSPPTSPMYSRPPTAMPIFEEAVVSPTQMWAREPDTAVPTCPCCTTETRMPPRPTTMSSSSARPSTSAEPRGLRSMKSARSLRRAPSNLSLRLKRSFSNLRRRDTSPPPPLPTPPVSLTSNA